MSLFSTIQQSSNALQVSQLGLHVTGNNIANANTPGYIRQELHQATAAGYKFGDIVLGHGVRAVGVVQKLDHFIIERMRGTQSELSSSDAVSSAYQQIESILGELTDSDLSSQLSQFSNSISDLLNQPGNESLRRLVIERGRALATNLRKLSSHMQDIKIQQNQEIRGTAGEINRATQHIAELNKRIVEIEGGRSSGSDAVGLRDERLIALQELSKIIDIRAVEQPSGSVTVYVGGEYLVAEGIHREVKHAIHDDGYSAEPEIRLVDTDSPLRVTAGRLHGLYVARDVAIKNIQQDLDSFAGDLINQFNQIHSQGQGSQGFSEVTATLASDDSTAPIDLAGFPVKIENGSFEIQVLDLETGSHTTHQVRVKLTGSADDASLEDVRDSISAISGVSATLTSDGKLRIAADSHRLRFSFQNDTSGVLAAVGINTFFTGDSANNINLNQVIVDDPRMLAISLNGVGTGTDNAIRLAAAFDEPLEGLGGRSFKQRYEDIVVRTTQDIDVQAGVSAGLKNFFRTLEGQHLSVSGVNLDEEAVKMIFYQRAFQATSRVIQASSEMLDYLVNL